jgi:lantibiotic modifying enzyme
MVGSAGISLFLYYYWKWTRQNAIYERATEVLNYNIEHINHMMSFSLYNGFAGIIWLIKHLEEECLIDENTDEIAEEIYPVLCETMIKEMDKGNYDYLHHALGIGFTCLKLNNIYTNTHLQKFILLLQKCSIRQSSGCVSWASNYIKDGKITKVYNTSMAHGLSGIIVFLVKLVKKQQCLIGFSNLLDDAVQFLIQQQQDSTVYSSNFPAIISATINYRNSKLAWCNGDLGIAIALWQASVVLDNKAYNSLSLRVFEDYYKKNDIKKMTNNDIGICHGISGIAHIFNRMYYNTQYDIFKKSTLFWIAELLLAMDTKSSMNYEKEPKNFLKGISGIGLVLLSAVSDIEPRWDECLLLS